MFVNWVYYQRLPAQIDKNSPVDLLQLANLWTLGERFKVPPL
jgi:hypothetical protein